MPPPASDFLGGQPACPNTPVPGQWLVDLPSSSSTIFIRRYRPLAHDEAADTPAEGVKRGNGDALLAKLGEDALEEGWRAVNGSGPSSTGDVDKVLRGGCGVIVRNEPESEGEGESKSKGRRELWCFYATESEAMMPRDSLQADPQVLSISMSRYISCTQHGHDLACLTRPNGGADGCDVIFSTSSDTARHWDYLTAAVVEKSSWRMGRRLWMLPRPGSSSAPPLHVSLRPLSATRLLLSLSPRRRTQCKSDSEGSKPSRQPQPVMLQHLDLPAIRLSALHPTAAQQSRLAVLFDTVLSPSWKASRSECRLATQLAGQQWSDWSIYWVPVPPPQDAADITQLLPQQVISHWQQRSGILTVWPTNLTSELSPRRPTSLKRKHEAAPDFTVPPTNDLLSTAFGLFESLTAAKPPEPEEPVKEESEVADEGRPIELTPEPLFDEDGVGSPKSDLDDLFSDNGDATPPTDEHGDASGESPVEGVTGQAQDDLFGVEGDESAVELIEGDVPMEEDEVPVGYEAQERGMDDRPDDTIMITEDDFAFFDTPAVSPEASAAIEQVMETKAPPPVELPTVHEVVEEVAEETKQPETLVDGGAADEVEQPSAQPSEPVPNTVASGDAAPPPPPRQTPSISPQVRFVELPPEPARSPSPQPPSPEHQIIPSEFEPVVLPSNTLPSLNYAFPSPAPTPESLRSDLVERLEKQTAKKAKYDYAADWATQDEPSETDEDESYTGAPPTPESDDDVELSRESTPEAKQDLVRDGDEVEFGGIRCIGAEWAWIKDEPEMLNAFARQWNQGWIEAGKANPTGALPPSPAPSPPDGNSECLANMDIDRLAGELISNRHFRQLLLPESFAADALDERDPLTKTGTPLSHLMPPSDDSSQIDDDIALAFLDTSDAIVDAVAEPKPLPMVNIHAGFAGYVTRLSIASLSYWRQMGLAPVGGKKDVSAVMICDAGEDSKRAAERLMKKLGATYETLGLGSHRPLETAKTPDGIAAVQASAFVESLDELLRGYSDSSDHLIVYVFFNNMAAATSPAALQLLFSSRPTPPTCSIHILTPTAIQTRHLQPIVREVYDRISRQIRRIEEYGHTLDEPPVWMRYPSFTLAPDQPPKMQLTLTWPLRSYDLLNKWRLVHGAYAYDKDLEMVVAFVIDSEGESHEVRTWRTKDMGMRERLQRLWDFFRVFADKAAIEWRMSICRLGAMSSDEAEVWRDIPRPRTAALSLLMALDPPSPGPAISRPRPAVPNITAAMLNDTSTRIIDESLTAHLTTSTQRLPVDLPDSDSSGRSSTSTSTQSVYPKSSFVLSVATPGAAGGENISSAYQVLSHVAAPGKEQEKVGEILGREFYRLLCLGRVRYGFEGSGMPVHLEGVRAVLEGMRTMSNGTR